MTWALILTIYAIGFVATAVTIFYTNKEEEAEEAAGMMLFGALLWPFGLILGVLFGPPLLLGHISAKRNKNIRAKRDEKIKNSSAHTQKNARGGA